MADSRKHMDDAERERVRLATNARISRLCIGAALVICVFSLGVLILGSQDPRFVMVGVTIAIILLAIALLQDNARR
jgi:intracellular septation protein A